MTVELAGMIMTGLGLYLLVGGLVGLVLALGGVSRIDPGAKGMPIRVRLLILPGLIGLWPLMLWKFIRNAEPPVQ